MRTKLRWMIGATALALMSGCTTVRMTNAGSAMKLAAKPESCAIQFHRLGAPSVPYEEVGSVLLEGSVFVSPEGAEKELSRQACLKGADAVVILSETYGVPFYGSSVRGVFIKFQDAAAADVAPK